MIEYSGQNWHLRDAGYRPTISVIEPPAESYDEYAERKLRERNAVRVPFGFSRVLRTARVPDPVYICHGCGWTGDGDMGALLDHRERCDNVHVVPIGTVQSR